MNIAPVFQVELPGPAIRRLFLHYFDIHFIEEKGTSSASPEFYREMRRATRIAVASADEVVVPAASYFESTLCRNIIGELDELRELGIVTLSASSQNLDDFVSERLDRVFYRESSSQASAYKLELHRQLKLPYVRRERGATRDIVDYWNRVVVDDSLARRLRDAAGRPITRLESRLVQVPEKLKGMAFIPEHVYEVLGVEREAPPVRTRLRDIINYAYFESYVRELSAGVVIDLRFLASAFAMPSFGPSLSYARMMRHLQEQGRVGELDDCSATDLLKMGKDPSWRYALTASATYVGREKSRGQLERACTPTVMCIAAAAAEFASTREKLEVEFGPGHTVQLDSRVSFAVAYRDNASGAYWYLVQLSFQGEVEAGVQIQPLISAIDPVLVIMVGMCMGMPHRRLAVGTVIVPNEVMYFDHQRQVADGGTQYRAHGNRTANELYTLARLLAEGSAWGFAVVADKGLASASVKIEDPESALVRHIALTFPDAAAFDMEGWGFYLAADRHRCLWVKAVADSGEAQGQSELARRGKQTVQSNVTKNAVTFAIAVVREFLRVDAAKSSW